eukprot:12409675-Alexandrium_andersonii.AAC.1
MTVYKPPRMPPDWFHPPRLPRACNLTNPSLDPPSTTSHTPSLNPKPSTPSPPNPRGGMGPPGR